MRQDVCRRNPTRIVVCLAACLTAVACSSGQSENDLEFLQSVGSEVPSLTSDQLISKANAACESLAQGESVADVYLKTLVSGLPEREAQALLVGAAVFYCPSFEEDVVVGLYSLNTQ